MVVDAAMQVKQVDNKERISLSVLLELAFIRQGEQPAKLNHRNAQIGVREDVERQWS